MTERPHVPAALQGELEQIAERGLLGYQARPELEALAKSHNLEYVAVWRAYRIVLGFRARRKS